MELIKKILFDIIVGIWFVIALFTTICLLSYNDFGVTTFGKQTLLIMDSDELEPAYPEGSLVVVKRSSDNKIDVGEKVFYYNSAMNSNILVFLGDVEKKEEVSKTDTTYTIDGEHVSGEFVIGSTKDAKTYNKLGTILSALTSRWGFMFFILFPMLFAIIYEVMMIVDAAKKDKNED